MRQQSRKKIVVRGVELGGEKVVICLPLVGAGRQDILDQGRELTGLEGDIIEWRVDGYDYLQDRAECLDTLMALREVIGNIPLLYTCRSVSEGGIHEVQNQERFDRTTDAIASGAVDLVDIELASESGFRTKVLEKAGKKGVPVILSSHNFHATPPEKELLEILQRSFEVGADIAKVAVMPKSYRDVLTLLSATDTARNSFAQGPLVTMSMGEMGKISRLAGGLWGSDMTFGAGKEVSAPGQLPVAKLKTFIDQLEG